jgi:hypothetical protein
VLTSGPVDSFREVHEMNTNGDTMSVHLHISTPELLLANVDEMWYRGIWAARSEACIVFFRSKAVIMGSNASRGIDVCM